MYVAFWLKPQQQTHGIYHPGIYFFGFIIHTSYTAYTMGRRGEVSGYKNRKKSGFQRGKTVISSRNTKLNDTNEDFDMTSFNEETNSPRIIRYSQSFFKDIVKETPSNELGIPGADGIDGSAKLLRPKPDESMVMDVDPEGDPERKLGTGEFNMDSGNILVEKSRYETLINTFIVEHSYSDCQSINIKTVDLRPWGAFISAKIMCTVCGKKSTCYQKLYEEVKTTKCGKKAAVGNVRLGLMMQDTSIGPTETKLLFAAVGLNIGTLNNLHKMQLRVTDVTEKMVRRDMDKWLDKAKDVLAARGVASTDQLSAQFDVLYHSMNRAHNNLPGQSASAATALCIETVTNSKKIIEFEHMNKTCAAGTRLRNANTKALCGYSTSKEHHNCTASVPVGKRIREYDMAKNIAERLQSKEYSVTHLCTDSDAKGRDAFSDVNDLNPALPKLVWYKDPSHLNRNMRTQLSICSIKGPMFGKKKDGTAFTCAEKKNCRKALALDVPRRVAHTIKQMRKYWGHHIEGYIVMMIENCEQVRDYMVTCYGGNHKSCAGSPLAQLTGCRGTGGRRWFNRSHTMKAMGISRLNLTEKNQVLLRKVIGVMLSKENIVYVARGETSSKCESSNKGSLHNLPKNKQYPKTGKGRVASGVNRINNGLEKSFEMKCAAMNVDIEPGTTPAYVLRRYQNKRNQTAKSQATDKAKQRRHDGIAYKSTMYFKQQSEATNQSDYLKFQLDTARETHAQAIDHVCDAEPSTSNEFVSKLKRAQCTNQHLSETLDHAYVKTVSTIATKRASTIKRKALKQQREIQKAAKAKWATCPQPSNANPHFVYYGLRKYSK